MDELVRLVKVCTDCKWFLSRVSRDHECGHEKSITCPSHTDLVTGQILSASYGSCKFQRSVAVDANRRTCTQQGYWFQPLETSDE
jgi:hypothetical protein